MPKFGDYTEAVTLNDTDEFLIKQNSSTLRTTINAIKQKVIEDVNPIISSSTVASGGYNTYSLVGFDVKNRTSDSILLFSSAENELVFIESITIVNNLLKKTANALVDVHVSLRKVYDLFAVTISDQIIGDASNPIKIEAPHDIFAGSELGYNGSSFLFGVSKIYSIAARNKTYSSSVGVEEDVYYPLNYDWKISKAASDYYLEIHQAPDNFLADDRMIIDIHVVYRKIVS